MARVYTMRRVIRIPDRNYVWWKLSGGAMVRDTLTDREYADLGKANAGPPPNRTGDAGAVFISAEGGVPTFSTITGDMEPGDITDAYPGMYTIAIVDLVSGKYPARIPADRFVGSGAQVTLVDTHDVRPGVTIVNGVATIPD